MSLLTAARRQQAWIKVAAGAVIIVVVIGGWIHAMYPFLAHGKYSDAGDRGAFGWASTCSLLLLGGNGLALDGAYLIRFGSPRGLFVPTTILPFAAAAFAVVISLARHPL